MQSDQNWAASGSASSIPKYECIFQSEPGWPSKTSMRQALASFFQQRRRKIGTWLLAKYRKHIIKHQLHKRRATTWCKANFWVADSSCCLGRGIHNVRLSGKLIADQTLGKQAQLVAFAMTTPCKVGTGRTFVQGSWHMTPEFTTSQRRPS